MAANMHASDQAHDSGSKMEHDELRFSVPSIPELWAEVEEQGARRERPFPPPDPSLLVELDSADVEAIWGVSQEAEPERNSVVETDPPDVEAVWDSSPADVSDPSSEAAMPEAAVPEKTVSDATAPKVGRVRRFFRWLVTPG